MQVQKKCSKCGELKFLSEFRVLKTSKDGREGSCSKCRAAERRQLRAEKKAGSYESFRSLRGREQRFFETCREAHEVGLYTYERVKYVDSNTPVEIFCTKHKGYFWQIPNTHALGIGCKQCGVSRRAEAFRKTQAEFLQECEAIHGSEYDYSNTVYVSYHTNVVIGCKKCGTSFEQTPATHLRGSGCPTCSAGGYSRSMSGSLYVMTAGDTTKVGITNLDPSIREAYLTNSARKVCPDFPSFKSVYTRTWEDGNIAYGIETMLLQQLQDRYEPSPHKFNGSTECFLNVDVDKLVKSLPP